MAAILLLVVYLFNVAGYMALFSLVIRHSDELLVQRLDRDQYDDHDLFQVKMPLHLPYYNSQADYERIHGEVIYKGVYYRYVKRKVANDTMYILCVKNRAKTKLYGAQTDYAKGTADFPAEKQNTAGKKATSLSEHNMQPAEYNFTLTTQASGQPVTAFTSPLYAVILNRDFQPPEPTKVCSSIFYIIYCISQDYKDACLTVQ